MSKYLHENFKIRKINSYPYVAKINNLLNGDEIDELLSMAKGKFQKSNIVVDGELVYDTKQRNSSTAYLFQDGMPYKYSKNIERMIKRICYLAKCKRSQLEIMCVRYKKGEQFGDHVDYFRDDEIDVLDSAGQRLATYFVYLNTLKKEDGGETEFTKLGIKSRPISGDALFWYNMDKKGRMMPETEHRGNPVLTNTVKYGLNIWIRSKPFY